MGRWIPAFLAMIFPIACLAEEPMQPGDDPSQWGIVVLARWKERLPATDKLPAGVQFETIRGLTTGFKPFPSLRWTGPIVYESDQILTGSPGDERILVRIKRGPRDFFDLVWAPTPAQQEFIKNIPLRDGEDELPVLAYHWSFLGNSDRKIARTSEIGFEHAGIDALVRLGRTLKVEDVKSRFRTATSNESLRTALAVVYASSGRDQVADEIRELAIPSGRFMNDRAITAAFLLSHGEPGLAELEALLQKPEHKDQARWPILALGQLPPGDPFTIEKTREILWKWAHESGRSRSALGAMQYHKDPTLAGYLELRFLATDTSPQLKRAVVQSVLDWVSSPLAKDRPEWLKAGQNLQGRLRTLEPALVAEVEAEEKQRRPRNVPAP